MSSLDLVIKAISSKTNPKKIILFGSFAYGNPTSVSDLDVAVIQNGPAKLGQSSKVFLALNKLGYDWKVEPDIHFFSEKEFEKKLKNKDLFISEIAKGKTVYVQ